MMLKGIVYDVTGFIYFGHWTYMLFNCSFIMSLGMYDVEGLVYDPREGAVAAHLCVLLVPIQRSMKSLSPLTSLIT